MPASTDVVIIELYDSGVRIGDGNDILIDTSSCALIESQAILVGEPAEHQAHLRPREISINFWGRLSKNSETKHVVNNANIALHHLEYACNEADCASQTVILITPITLDKQDLGLLLGICKKLSLNVAGIVCNATLVMQQPIENGKAIFLDLLQQNLAITELIQTKKEVSLKQPSRIINFGIQSFINNCAHSIAEKFISETRFDPLHSANDEQLFFDMLPLWLSMLEESHSIECKLNTSDKHYSINIDRHYLKQCNQILFDEVAAHLNVLFHDHESIVIFCSSSCKQAFGLLSFLTNLPGCAVIALTQDNIIKHAFNCSDKLINEEQVHYVNTLSWQENTIPIAAQFNTGRLSNIASKPTHLLIDGHAYSLQESLFLHRDNDGDDTVATVTREHSENALCEITTNNINIVVSVFADDSVHINYSLIENKAFANIGDVITISNFQADYEFIKVVQNET